MVLRLKSRESRSSPGLPRAVGTFFARYRASRYLSACADAPRAFQAHHRDYPLLHGRWLANDVSCACEKPPRVKSRRLFVSSSAAASPGCVSTPQARRRWARAGTKRAPSAQARSPSLAAARNCSRAEARKVPRGRSKARLAAHDLRRHGARVEPSAAREQAELQRQADGEMTPQAEPHFGGVVIERRSGMCTGTSSS